jgi:hypothetical protein
LRPTFPQFHRNDERNPCSTTLYQARRPAFPRPARRRQR